ncbi:MAG TPA: hypothetical protein VNZ53_54320 [Steroidobacteraceae bacterium]|nr:hypothetical protein [Steroidobacteraceae bacterium]
MKATLNFSLQLAVLVFMCAATARAAPNSAERVHAFARLPDWGGIWLSTVWLADESGRPPGGSAQVGANAQLRRAPPYNQEWAAIYEAGMKDTAALAARNAVFKVCLRTFPALMEGPRMFQVAVLPEETLLVFESGQVRHIYTDGRAHPPADELWETPLGDSVGHWERDVLVIDTIARLSTDPVTVQAWVSLLSKEAKITERFRLVDPDTLENQLTIDDPAAFARPWNITLRYKRQRNMHRMLPYDCDENDRNPVVDGKLGIAPR